MSKQEVRVGQVWRWCNGATATVSYVCRDPGLKDNPVVFFSDGMVSARMLNEAATLIIDEHGNEVAHGARESGE